MKEKRFTKEDLRPVIEGLLIPIFIFFVFFTFGLSLGIFILAAMALSTAITLSITILLEELFPGTDIETLDSREIGRLRTSSLDGAEYILSLAADGGEVAEEMSEQISRILEVERKVDKEASNAKAVLSELDDLLTEIGMEMEIEKIAKEALKAKKKEDYNKELIESLKENAYE